MGSGVALQSPGVRVTRRQGHPASGSPGVSRGRGPRRSSGGGAHLRGAARLPPGMARRAAAPTATLSTGTCSSPRRSCNQVGGAASSGARQAGRGTCRLSWPGPRPCRSLRPAPAPRIRPPPPPRRVSRRIYLSSIRVYVVYTCICRLYVYMSSILVACTVDLYRRHATSHAAPHRQHDAAPSTASTDRHVHRPQWTKPRSVRQSHAGDTASERHSPPRRLTPHTTLVPLFLCPLVPFSSPPSRSPPPAAHLSVNRTTESCAAAPPRHH
jgi:hypothetical protein